MFSLHLGPIRLLEGQIQANRGEILTFGQTFQLRLEKW